MASTILNGFIYVLVGGGISVGTIWINWIIEKRRERFKWRKGFMLECKRIIDGRDFSIDLFREGFLYSNLKPYLSDNIRKEIAKQRYIPGKLMTPEQRSALTMKEYAVKKRLLDEITSIEIKWGLL
jgi:hypothetical protein